MPDGSSTRPAPPKLSVTWEFRDIVLDIDEDSFGEVESDGDHSRDNTRCA